MSFIEKIEALEVHKGLKTYNKAYRSGVTITRNGQNMYMVTLTINGWDTAVMYVDSFKEYNAIIGMYVGDMYVGYFSKFMVGIE